MDDVSSGPRLRRAQLVLALAPVAVWACMAWRARWVCDDAFIDFAVVRNVLAGAGPTLNVGQRVESFTNPLWVALLSLASAMVPGDPTQTLPWIAVLLGLALSLAGLALPSVAACRRHDPTTARAFALPLGSLVVAALVPFHDFATSGLETGLTLAWLGLSWTLVDPARTTPPAAPRVVAVVLGLGPLVRPDLAVFALALGALHVTALASLSRRRALVSACVTAAPATLYQVWRMAWYGCALPTTALAKEPGLTRWDQGWCYLLDFATPYGLVVPVLALCVAVALAGRRAWRWYVLPAAALTHAVSIVRLGGDFMHARMLLPSLFALCLPVVVVAGEVRRTVAVLAPWSLVALLVLRPPSGEMTPSGITNERAFYVASAGVANPVTLDDYRGTPWYQGGAALRAMAASAQRRLTVASAITSEGRRLAGITVPSLRAGVPVRVVAANALALGITASVAGPSVWLLDAHGLADPFAARVELTTRGRPGHEKVLPPSWLVARYADLDDPGVQPGLRDHPAVAAARRALRCGPLVELDDATRAPLTWRRALRNLRVAFSLTRLRIPADPRVAVVRFCGR